MNGKCIDIKHVIYKIVLPVYLWSIGFESLEEYIDSILDDEQLVGNIKRIN